MNERIDTLDKEFNRVNRVSVASRFVFWLSLICSYLIFFTDQKPKINYVITIIFVLLTILYFFISNWLSIFLLREAQSKRRIHLISDSLGVKLDDEETNLYYNNPQNPSILRLGMNVFENTLFSWRTAEQMLKLNRVMVVVYIFIWLLLVLVRETELNLIATVAQTIFTTGILLSWIKLEVLRYTCKKLFEEFRQTFFTSGSKLNVKVKATILNLVMKYETLIASMGVNLSTRAFNEINPTVTKEWEKIKENIKI